MENLRNKVCSTSDGKDVRDTMQLKGEAKKSSVANAKNTTKQYTTSGGVPKGSLGGMNTNS